MIHRKYFNWIIAIAICSILFAFLFMWNEKHTVDTLPPPKTSPHPISPFAKYISAVGIVEASSENIYIGSPMNRIIEKVEVEVNKKVKKGQILFRLEARDLIAEVQTRTIMYENAVANLQKLEALPRPEDVASAEAAAKIATLELAELKSQYERVAGLQNSGAMSQEEVNRRRFAYEQSEAKVQQAQANLDKTKAGTWLPDLEIARLQVSQAEAQVKKLKTEIERTLIRSPIDATVLQIKIHDGEFPPADSARSPAMIIGDTDKMHVRVNINQFDASYYRPEAPAVAFLQGNAQISFPLVFVQIEPLFVAKQNLTNDVSEKVDTRVLQAIYAFKEGRNNVFVGQQMDVFIENQFEQQQPQQQ